MSKILLGLCGLVVFGLPQVAGAERFGANYRYAAKYACGYASGSESRLGVVEGHYNTTINIQAIKDRTAFAYRASALRSNLDVSWDSPSDFSTRFDRDRDAGRGLICSDIKRILNVSGQEGYVEGFVNIYSTKPLNVVSVLTGEDSNDVSVMELLESREQSVAENIEFRAEFD